MRPYESTQSPDDLGPSAGAPRLRQLSIEEAPDTLPDAPTATSRGRGWSGVTVDVHASLRRCAIHSPAHDHHLVCYCPSGNGRLVQSRNGVTHSGLIGAGMSLLMPAGLDSVWEGDAPTSVRLRIPPQLLAAAAEQLGGQASDGVDLRNAFEMRDVTIERIAQTLMGEVGRAPHPAQRIIVETLSNALAAHLLRRDGLLDCRPAAGARLGAAELAKLTAFIEENLDQPIELGQLAAIVNVSRFHFTRLFKRSTGITAITFVEQRRVRRAQALITDSDVPLAEVALLTGFADQSHFTRRFHLHVGCTPAAYARAHGRRRPARRRSGWDA